MKLFEIEPIEQSKHKCKECEYSAPYYRHYNSIYVSWYCSAIKSKRTSNGMLKIKANQTACKLFKKAEQ